MLSLKKKLNNVSIKSIKRSFIFFPHYRLPHVIFWQPELWVGIKFLEEHFRADEWVLIVFTKK